MNERKEGTPESNSAGGTSSASATLTEWSERILQADPRAVARAITAIENQTPTAQELFRLLFPHTGRAGLIGITGAAGSGKSTLVDALTAALRRSGHSVGVLAVDPTSPFTGGAILGDRVRMQKHGTDDGVYIRSMATRGALGGLASATFDAAMVLDAAGKQFILIETVGAGQAEVEIARAADVTLLLLVPGTGDDVQALKAGLMEIADIIVINKSDHAGADRLEQEIHAALSLSPAGTVAPPVLRTIATEAKGIDELVSATLGRLDSARKTGTMETRRKALFRERVLKVVQERILGRVLPHSQTGSSDQLDKIAEALTARRIDPYTAAEQILPGVAKPDQLADNQAAALDHIGIAAGPLAQAVAFYEGVLGLKISGYETIEQEKTKVAMVPVGDTRIELLEPTATDSPIARFLAKRGVGLHHICLRVPDLAAAVQRLRESGAQIINDSPGIGAGGHRYVFVHPSSAGGVLLELVERE